MCVANAAFFRAKFTECHCNVQTVVKLETDPGNYGLTGTTASPGFYAEWEIVDGDADGAACHDDFQATPHTAMVDHNNEKIDGTVDECKAACCARHWCHSFDYIEQLQQCNLADIDSSTQMATTGTTAYNTLYERKSARRDAAGPNGATGCANQLSLISAKVNTECCPRGGCARGAPDSCSEECAAAWMPFAKACSAFLAQTGGPLTQVTETCEREEYGRYHAGSNHGRCSDGDLAEYKKQFAPACCGEDSVDCPNFNPGWEAITTPTKNNQPYCSADCARFAEEFHAVQSARACILHICSR